MRELSIYRGQQQIAAVTDDSGLIRLQYIPEYLQAAHAQPISLSLPLKAEWVEPPRPGNFIANLLPEGHIRELMSRRLRIDESDDIALIEKIGSECAGALTILPGGTEPPTQDPRYEPMTPHELGNYITQFQSQPVSPFRGAPMRLSLAGAQSKSAIAIFDGQPHHVIQGASTHIIKPPPMADAGLKDAYPNVVLNEFICSKLASMCQLLIPPIQLLPFTTYRDGTPMYALCIERFDRHIIANNVERLHQEDFCQALGVPPGRKYEQYDGVSLRQMIDLVRSPDAASTPAAAFTQFLRHFLFNLLIGNADAHAKNYALLYVGAKRELAPAYDLVCTMAYPQLDRRLPQLIGRGDRIDTLSHSELVDGLGAVDVKAGAVQRALLGLARVLDSALKTDPCSWIANHGDPDLEQSIQAVHTQIAEIARTQIDRLVH